MTTEGLSSASSIAVGARLDGVYWSVPGHYGIGPAFESREAALEDALSRVEDGYAITIDLRWKLSYPGGGGVDTVAERTTYSTVESAQDHLDRIRRYSGEPYSTGSAVARD